LVESVGTNVGKKGACVEASADTERSETVGRKGVGAASISASSSSPSEL